MKKDCFQNSIKIKFQYKEYVCKRYVRTGELEYFIENAGDNISKNFVEVFPDGHKNRFHSISKAIRSKGAEYPFMIANTDAEDKPGTDWWSFLDIE